MLPPVAPRSGMIPPLNLDKPFRSAQLEVVGGLECVDALLELSYDGEALRGSLFTCELVASLRGSRVITLFFIIIIWISRRGRNPPLPVSN